MGDKFVAETPQDRDKRIAAQTEQVESTQPIDIKTFLNVYEFETTLLGSGQVVKFKSVTTGQMKKMLAYEEATEAEEIEQALDELITDCVISPDFDINKLYLQDRFSLLLEIRRNTKGDSYNYQWKCPVCSLPQPTTTKLSELEVLPIKEMETIVEINDNLKADFTFPTREIQKRATAAFDSKGMTESEKMYETGLYVYALCMTNFETPVGKTQPSLEDKVHVLNNVGTTVLEEIRDWLSENEFGVKFSTDAKCNNPDCGFEHHMEIPVTDFFV
jgi:hypothetical protein